MVRQTIADLTFNPLSLQYFSLNLRTSLDNLKDDKETFISVLSLFCGNFQKLLEVTGI